MADYDLSKPAPDRSSYDAGSGAGGMGFILAGAVIVLVVLYAVFGGAGVSVPAEPGDIAVPEAAPAVESATGNERTVAPTE